ncbi:MAG: hypothetical protein C0490_18035, partial [Marivirga sp.]|nr:hypothetical protein [Marivirga sp.]
HAIKPTGQYIGVNYLTTQGDLEKVALVGDANKINSLMVELQRIVTKVNLEIDDYLSRAY